LFFVLHHQPHTTQPSFRKQPRKDALPKSDKIIRFPGKDAGKKGADPKGTPPEDALAGLSEEQRKAIGIVLSGTAFVVVGIKPSERGADFFTAVAGDHTDLRNAQPHLAGVIERALSRKGV
jgi:hypothetical protein